MAASEEYDIHIYTPNYQEIVLNIEPSKTVQELMVSIQAAEGIPVQKQVIYFNNKPLDCGKTLRDYEIYSGASLCLNFGRPGSASFGATN